MEEIIALMLSRAMNPTRFVRVPCSAEIIFTNSAPVALLGRAHQQLVRVVRPVGQHSMRIVVTLRKQFSVAS